MQWVGSKTARLGVRLALQTLVVLCASGGTADAAEIAVLKSLDTPGWRPAVDALRRSARGHHVLELDLKGARPEGERVVGELKGRAGLVVVAMGPLAAQVARESLPGVPLVLCMVQDPAGLRLLGAPNTVAVSFAAPARDQLFAIRLLTPGAATVGIMYSSEELVRPMRDARDAPDLQQLVLLQRVFSSPRQVPGIVQRLLAGREAADVLWLPPDPMLLAFDTRRHIMSEALKARKPVYTFSPALLAEGALASVGPEMASIGVLAADLAGKLIAGRPVRGVVETATTEIVINGRIAQQLGLDVPDEATIAGRKISIMVDTATARP